MYEQPAFLTVTLVREAVELAAQMLRPWFENGANAPKRPFIAVVILDNQGQVLYQETIGTAPEGRAFEGECLLVARSKAELHYRTGRPSGEVQERAPNLLKTGETIYGGSASCEGVIVGASGVEAFFDEVCAMLVAGIVWGFCMRDRKRYLEHPDKPRRYGQRLSTEHDSI